MQLSMQPFLKTFGREVEITSGDKIGCKILAIIDAINEQFITGRTIIKENKYALKIADTDAEGLQIEDKIMIKKTEYGIESIDIDLEGMAVLVVNREL